MGAQDASTQVGLRLAGLPHTWSVRCAAVSTMRRVLVALAVELACAGQRMPSLEVLGYCAVQQRSLGVTRVVELGFGC